MVWNMNEQVTLRSSAYFHGYYQIMFSLEWIRLCCAKCSLLNYNRSVPFLLENGLTSLRAMVSDKGPWTSPPSMVPRRYIHLKNRRKNPVAWYDIVRFMSLLVYFRLVSFCTFGKDQVVYPRLCCPLAHLDISHLGPVSELAITLSAFHCPVLAAWIQSAIPPKRIWRFVSPGP